MGLYSNRFDNTSKVAEKRLVQEHALGNGRCDVQSVLDYLIQRNGGEIDGRYDLDKYTARCSGGQACVAMVHNKFGAAFAIKFFTDHSTFVKEAEIYTLLVCPHSVLGLSVNTPSKVQNTFRRFFVIPRSCPVTASTWILATPSVTWV